MSIKVLSKESLPCCDVGVDEIETDPIITW